MLNTYGQNAVGFHFKCLAGPVLRAHFDSLGPRDSLVKTRYRQTALVILRKFILNDLKFRIDEGQRAIFIFRDINDQQSFVDIDLRGRKPDPLRGIHGFEHVIDQHF